MTEYDQFRAAERMLEDLRQKICTKIEAKEGDQRQLTDLHQRVSQALRAMSSQGR